VLTIGNIGAIASNAAITLFRERKSKGRHTLAARQSRSLWFLASGLHSPNRPSHRRLSSEEPLMEFRWIIILALYTLLIGPVLDKPWSDAGASARSQTTRLAASR
jgi:hypothetical protein